MRCHGKGAPGARPRRPVAEVWTLVLLSILACPAHALGEPESAARLLRWRWSDEIVGFAEEGGFSAIASDEARGWLAVGDADGARVRSVSPTPGLRSPGAIESFRGRIKGVRDLAFDPRGNLWIASDTGLWRLNPQGQLESRGPGPGRESRWVSRIEMSRGVAVVATRDGVYASSDLGSWLHVDAEFPSGPISAIALVLEGSPRPEKSPQPETSLQPEKSPQPTAGAVPTLYAVVGARLWSARLEVDDVVGLRARDVRRVPVPGRPPEGEPVDLVSGLPGAELALVYPQRLIVRSISEQAGAEWRTIRPSLPPGSTIRRLHNRQGVSWLTTDQGLLHSTSLDGPWHRAGPPAGKAAVANIAWLGNQLFAATARGLLQGVPLAVASFGSAAQLDPREFATRGPSILEVQRAALRYVGLETTKLEHAYKSLGRRAWLPVMGLRFGVDQGRGRRRDHDQSFSSGEVHDLFDDERDSSLDLDGYVTLTWNWRDLIYDPEIIDLSREGRQVISLRDNVLDEVNQLYYERRALEIQLVASRSRSAASSVLAYDTLESQPPAPGSSPTPASPPSASTPAGVPGEVFLERMKLELRIGELAAGLDGWTGGWFSRQLEAASGF